MAFGDLHKGNAGARSGGAYFRPDQYTGAYAILIEPKRYRADAPNPFEVGTTRQELDADLTVFASEAHLKAGEGTALPNQTFTQPYLAGDLKDSLGGVEVARVTKTPAKNGRQGSWVWRPVPPEVLEAVAAFYDAREAALTESLNDDETPAFLKGA